MNALERKEGRGRSAVLQPEIHPLPTLRQPWFKKNTIVCDEGWSLSFSGSTWRVDRYDYREDGRHLVLGGEGAAGQMDIFTSANLTWEVPANVVLDDETRARVLHNVTAALQWAGFKVGFFSLDDPTCAG